MIGTTLGHFKITDKLGEGGMGEVYRAEDTKLGREVALKVLPEAFAQDRERMGRFAREAQVLASLNNANIASIYGLEEAGDRPALVMELVEGPTLEERIGRGAVTLEETARVGLEMARALEVAHEKGIVHRDLKPANVKLTDEGQVKILDFGLAKALEEEGREAGDLAKSPTLTAAATQAGIILGTAAYMSPEQAAGATADRRADIWSYGVVLLEMLTGRQQFAGETVSHTLASVLKDEPDWSDFPAQVPPRIVDLLQRCLRKDPRKRLQAIGEARVLFEEYLADPGAFEAPVEEEQPGIEPIPAWKRRLPWVVAGVLALGLGMAMLQWITLASTPRKLVRTTVLPPEKHDWFLEATFPGRVAISADGRQLAFSAVAEEGGERPMLWIRPLDSPVARSVQDTEGASYPFWSPDGRHVAFYADGKLKKVASAGGPPVTLCDAPYGKGGSWSRQGTIIFPPDAAGGVSKVSDSGGECTPVTELDAAAGDNSHRHPWFLPDGNRFLYLARRGAALGAENTVRVGSLDGETDKDLVKAPSNAAYASGRLLFLRRNTLMAQPFDADRLELSGEAVPLVEDVLNISAAALSVFSVSETGELVYQTGQSNETSQLVWLDRKGLQVGTLGEPADQSGFAMSNDGSRVVVTMVGEGGQNDLWIYDVERDLRTRFTFSSDSDVGGAWSNSGDRVVFSSNRESGTFDLYLKTVGGTTDAELLLSDAAGKFPSRWTPDDSMVLYFASLPGEPWDLYALPIDGERTPIRLTETEFAELRPSVSPDGRWLLYTSDESGRTEVYATTFPEAERKWQVSTRGGRQPTWTKGGTEVVYLGFERTSIFAAEIDSESDSLRVGRVEKLFEADLKQDLGQDWAVTEDGERFLINAAAERGRVSALHFVANWPAILD